MYNGKIIQCGISLISGIYGISKFIRTEPFMPIICLMVGLIFAILLDFVIPLIPGKSGKDLHFWWYSEIE